jgi:tRNA1Val (adenine37-N6)-methyltransferase
MGNQEFIFKQFKINQDKCAMKIGTDSVLLGAWADLPQSGKFLDIGSGTGVLALMMAQRSEANIIAIEIDNEAAIQAKDNLKKSKWHSRLDIINCDIKDINTSQKFDYIICNPPFFSSPNNGLNTNRIIARHNNELDTKDLLNIVLMLLAKTGKFGFIMPIEQADILISKAKASGLFCIRKTYLKPTPTKQAHRLMAELSKQDSECKTNTIVIEQSGRHQYSPEYIELTRDFYLFM